MRKLVLTIIFIFLFFMAINAFASGANVNNNNGPTFGGGPTEVTNTNTNQNKAYGGNAKSHSNANATGLGIGVGYGAGGDGGNASVKSSNKNTLQNTNKLGQGQSQSDQFQGSVNSELNITHEAQKRNPVNSAIAPDITISHLSCRSGVSGAAQGTGFGFSFGSTSDDEACETRMDALLLSRLGLDVEAVLRLCDNPKIAKAFKGGGRIQCPVVVDGRSTTYDPNSP